MSYQHSTVPTKRRGPTVLAAILIAAALAAIGSLTLAVTQPLDGGEPTVTPSPRSNSAPVAPAGQLDQAAPLVCAAAEDSQPIDCVTGAPLDYRNGGWYR